MIESTCRDNLLAIAAAYAKASKLTLDQVSKRYYGSTTFLRGFRKGEQSISLRKFDDFVEAIRADWPEDAPWPFTHAAIIPPQKTGKKIPARTVPDKSNRLSPRHERTAAS